MIYQGIEYQVRASLGRDEWVLLIYFPDKPDGKATIHWNESRGGWSSAPQD
jgi:hypothetical protein